MALDNRLVQNIDLRADGTALQGALRSIGQALNSIIKQSGTLSKNLEEGGKSGTREFENQIKVMGRLVQQAKQLQQILDTKGTGRAKGILDEQKLGRESAAAAKLGKDITSTTRAVEALEVRLGKVNQQFARLSEQGRTPTSRQLTKQFKIEEALRQAKELERQFTRLNGLSLNTKSKGQSAEMQKLRAGIEAVNKELLKTGQNTRITNFQGRIDQLRALIASYQQLIAVETREKQMSGGRFDSANRTAQNILGQSEAQRAASLARRTSQFAYPSITAADTDKAAAAEARLTENAAKRLRIMNMIQAAQDRGAPVRSVERLNIAYDKLTGTLAADLKLIEAVNRAIAQTPEGRNKKINDYLFGDGGVGFSKRIAGAAVITTGVFAAINSIRDAARFVVDFEKQLSQLQAISGSTDKQMVQLANSITLVGRDSVFSTLEIAKAAQVIAQAGYSAAETGQVLKAAITLSSGAGVEPGAAVEVLTSALGAFQLQASEASRVVDVLVTGLNESKLSIEQMASAIQYAGATAKENGVRFEELTAIAASLANAGIRSGSTIGTGLRQLLVDLKTPTAEFKKELSTVGLTLADVDVKAVGFAEVIQRLTKAGFGAEAAYESFEVRAASTFLAFKNQIPVYDQLALSIAKGGAAAEAQSKSVDNLGAQFTRLMNVLGSLAVRLSGPILAGLQGVTEVFANLFEMIDDGMRQLDEMTTGVDALDGALTLLAGTGSGALIGSFFGPVGAIIGGIIGTVYGLIGAIGGLSDALDESKTAASDAASAYDSQSQKIVSLDEAIGSLIERQGSLKDGSMALQTESATLGTRFSELYSHLKDTKGGYEDLLTAMQNIRNETVKQQQLTAEMGASTQKTLEINLKKQLSDTAYTPYNPLNPAHTIGDAGGFGRSYVNRDIGLATLRNRGQSGLAKDAISALSDSDANALANIWTRINDFGNAGNETLRIQLRELLKQIKERQAIAAQLDAAQAQGNLFNSQAAVAAARGSKPGTDISRRINKLTSHISKGLGANKATPSSGDALLAAAEAEGGELVKYLQQVLGNLQAGSPAYKVIEQDILLAREQLTRSKRAAVKAAEETDKYQPDTARKGLNLTGAQVAANIKKQFPGANPRSFGKRSLAEQKYLFNEYKAGRGAMAAEPGKSHHGTGNALDMNPLPGQSIDEVVAYIEGLGLEVTERFVEKTPKTGGTHWHIAWKAKSSTFQSKNDDAFEKLQKLQASTATAASSAKISALISSAKAGTGDPVKLRQDLDTAFKEFAKNSLDEFDTNNPGKDSVTALARQNKQAELAENYKKFVADLYKQIGDTISKAFAEALEVIDRNLADDTYFAETGVRNLANLKEKASSPMNARRNADAGTQFYFEKKDFSTRLGADQNILGARERSEAAMLAEINAQQARVSQIPDTKENSESRTAQLKEINDAVTKLNESMNTTAELQASINARTQEYTALPLAERLREGAAAWLQNAGGADSLADVLANNLNSALDTVSTGLADMFTKLVTGQATIKQALGSFLKSIGDFILQLIAKALALQAIKWFLSLIGVSFDGTNFGSTSAAPAASPSYSGFNSRAMNGGPAVKPHKFMGGGQIMDGVSNRDTVPILAARKEYIMRGAAVDSLGLPALDAMNKHGSKALDKLGGNTLVTSQGKQEMNVYIVKPEEKPQLGPNDVLLIIQDDLMQGGQTKRLVRNISQGG